MTNKTIDMGIKKSDIDFIAKNKYPFESVNERIEKLTKVLYMRLEGKTFDEIGKDMKLTRQRAQQLELSALILIIESQRAYEKN